MKALEFLLGLLLWAIILAGMTGASVALGAIMWALLK